MSRSTRSAPTSIYLSRAQDQCNVSVFIQSIFLIVARVFSFGWKETEERWIRKKKSKKKTWNPFLPVITSTLVDVCHHGRQSKAKQESEKNEYGKAHIKAYILHATLNEIHVACFSFSVSPSSSIVFTLAFFFSLFMFAVSVGFY